MRTERPRPRPPALAVLAALCGLLAGTAMAADEPAAKEASAEAAPKVGEDWQSWQPNTNVTDLASVQRGARNFVSYCLGCHSLKYERWSRVGTDLAIPPELLQKDLIPPGDKATQYILTSMPAEDAVTWFGKVPPDLTLMLRARGRAYVYQFLRTFYVDPTRQTGVNNLRLPTTAMPHVLSELEGLKAAVFKPAAAAAGTEASEAPPLDHFEQIAPGRLSAAEYDAFVKDTVNFLDYVSEPTQAARRSLGVWVVLFLLVFTWLAWLVKREYWKDVH
ncbi:MAG TPA: cytochrome c1 [Steroidobacteraceae bacterium]|jgi:ubiquinol-cytochrome c reductase cytochrome c1 subunit|nr:cytochrome c1 [Steroidobacteraceae bacterium]